MPDKPAFKPFADDAAAMSIGDMKAENGCDKIALYGSLDLTKDQAGLNTARKLKTFVDDIVKTLEGERDLPAEIAPPLAAEEVKNPFG